MKNTHFNSASRRFYKPSTTRTPVLVFLLLVTLALVGVTELACRHIPTHEGIGRLGDAVTKVLSKRTSGVRLSPRQTASSKVSQVPATASVSAPQISVQLSGTAGNTPTVISPAQPTGTVTNLKGPLSLGGSSTPIASSTLYLTSGGYLTPGKTTTPSVISASTTGGYLTPGKTTSVPVTQTTGPSNYLPVGPPVVYVPTSTVTNGQLTPGDPITQAPVQPIGPTSSPSPGSSFQPQIPSSGQLTTGPPIPTATPLQATPGGQLSLGNSVTPPVSSTPKPEVTPIYVPQSTATGGELSIGNSLTAVNSQPTPSLVGSGQLSLGDSKSTLATATGAQLSVSSTPQPTLVFVDGHVSTQTSPSIATDSKGSPLPILTSMDGKTYAVTPIMTVINGHTVAQTPVLTAVDGKALAVTPVVTVIDGTTFTQTPVYTVIDGKTYAQTPYITVSDGKTYTRMPPLIGAVSTGTPQSGYLTASATEKAVIPTATIVNSTGTYFAWSNGVTAIAPQITLHQYVLIAFVPLIIATVYTIPWRILDSTFREMEPFYQLQQKGGALGRNSLCLNYNTSFLVTVPFKALYRGHFIPFWSSLISLSVLFLAPLSSTAFFVSVTGDCGPNSKGQCHGHWGIYITLARCIEGILAFIAVLLVLIIISHGRRNSGVYSEPLSIVGMAVLLSKSPLLKGLRQIDSLIGMKELRELLSHKRFSLTAFVAMDGSRSHGIIPLDTGDEIAFYASIAKAGKKGRYSAVSQSTDDFGISTPEPPQNPQPKISGTWQDIRQKGFYFAAFLILGGLFTLITYYHYTGPDPVTGISSGFETFMDSQSFEVRFMMTALGVAIKLLWSHIDTDLRRTTPFASLLRGSATPTDSILTPFHASPITSIFPSLTRKHFLVSLVALLAVLAEFLPLLLANIAFSSATTKFAYEVCNACSMAILALMVLTTVILILRKSSKIGTLPRRPEQAGWLAGLAVYLCGSGSQVEGMGDGSAERSLLDAVEGLGGVSGRERDDAVKGLGALWSIGWVGDVDGGEGELRIDDDRRVRRLWND